MLAMEERKYFFNTLPRNGVATTVKMDVAQLTSMARVGDGVIAPGREIIFLYRTAQVRLMSECRILSEGSICRSLTNEIQLLVCLERCDGTTCEIGLSPITYWTPATNAYDFVWCVRGD